VARLEALDHLVLRVRLDLQVPQVPPECQVRLVELDRWVHLEQLAPQDLRELEEQLVRKAVLDFPAPRVQRAVLDLRDLLDPAVLLVLRDHPVLLDLPDLAALWDQGGHLDHRALTVRQDLLDLLEFQEPLVVLVLRELTAFLESLVRVDHLARVDLAD